tara:strand:- start:291 stop:485 length:195 start_codon:yes stop_codon:yes gene_type:complete
MKVTLEKIQDEIAELRDADYHVCPNAQWNQWVDEGLKVDEEPECSCRYFDAVIDLIDKYKENNK